MMRFIFLAVLHQRALHTVTFDEPYNSIRITNHHIFSFDLPFVRDEDIKRKIKEEIDSLPKEKNSVWIVHQVTFVHCG